MKTSAPSVLNLSAYSSDDLRSVLGRFGLSLVITPEQQPIPGSYWGEQEAGLIGSQLLARADTPVHSILHEACHFICMDMQRRQSLDTNAGGGYDEENAVCFLQVLLADQLPGIGRAKMFRDMDTWGYSFRLGSARAWFEQDAEEARDWLVQHRLIHRQGRAEAENWSDGSGLPSSWVPTYGVRDQ